MRIVVTGGTGNVGTSVIRRLAEDDGVRSIVGLARRRPDLQLPKTTWAPADVTSDDLVEHFRGADAVVHLAWVLRPSHDPAMQWSVNVVGSRRVFDAVAAAGVPSLVHASSIGAYSPAPKDRLVDESWPTDGIATSEYSTQKAYLERALDDFEQRHPELRVVRLRPALIFKAEAGSQIRRYFLGPLASPRLLRHLRLPFLPNVGALRFQAVHGDDMAEAYRLAAVGDARGPFNIAAEDVLDGPVLAREFGVPALPLPGAALRGAAAATWHLRLQPTSPGWVDMALQGPLLDAGRAREQLGWRPAKTGLQAVRELVEGIREGVGTDTPPLHADAPSRSQDR